MLKVDSHGARRFLSFDQVERLVEDNRATTRAATAMAVADAYGDKLLSPAEREMAEDVLALLARDVELEVRQAVAEHVKACPFLPRSLALTLAQDVETVALPVLRYSDVLTDDDLIQIVHQGENVKVMEIARRKALGPALSEAVVEHGTEAAVTLLVSNEGAEVTEPVMGQAMDRFPASRTIERGLINRRELPPAVIARLIGQVSDELRLRLVQRHGMPEEIVETVVEQGSELAVTRSLSAMAGPDELVRMVDELMAATRLTPTLLLRALCCGELALFEISLARMSGMAPDKVQAILKGGDQAAFQALYDSAALPEDFFRAFRIAARSAVMLLARRGQGQDQEWQAKFTRQIVQKIAIEYDRLDPDNLEALLSQLSHLRDWTGTSRDGWLRPDA